MEDRYGDLWAQRFGGVPKDRLMRSWAQDLADLSGEEIACGLLACRDHKFVPSLPDFRALCRPPIDFDGALLEAIEQMALRESGRDRWSHPAIYWAAAKIGAYELGSKTLRDLNAEWRKAFGNQLALGQWPEIPERLPALPAPGQTHNREVGGETIAEMLRRLKASADAQCKERGE